MNTSEILKMGLIRISEEDRLKAKPEEIPERKLFDAIQYIRPTNSLHKKLYPCS